MERKLDFKLADISTYVYEGYPLGIMKTHGEKYREWMLSNYVQLNCHKNIIKEKCVFLAFYGDVGIYSPFIKKEHFCWSILSKYDINLIKFFKDNIDLGCYLYFKVDEYYIPNRDAYRNYHFLHDIMIIGYGDDYFITIGYDDKGQCSEMNISIETFMEALNNNKSDIKKNQWQDSIYFMRYVDADYEFNINLVKLTLKEYLNSTCKMDQMKRFTNPLKDTVFGVEVYDKVLEYLDILINVGNIFYGGGNIDNRIFRGIKEHKQLMYDRIRLIQTKTGGVNDLIEKYSKINKLASSVHYLAIKYQLSLDKEVLVKLKKMIRIIKQDDEIVLGKLYERL